MKVIKPHEILDLKGVPCPQNTARALLKLAGMQTGEILEVIIDDGEPRENVPASLEEEKNYEMIGITQTDDKLWHLLIKVLE